MGQPLFPPPPISAVEQGAAAGSPGSGLPRSQESKLPSWLTPKAALPPVLFASALIAFWYVMVELLSDRKKLLLPRPHTMFGETILNSEIRSELWSGLLVTAKVALVGLFISMIFGIVGAVVMNSAPWAERAFFPWAVVIQTLPTLALVPLIGIWFGFGFTSRLIVVVMISMFPILTNTLFGLQSADTDLHNLFTLQGASRATRLFKLEFPAALPAMFTGFRIAAGLSVIGAIVAEFFFGRGAKGLGNLVSKYRGLAQMSELYASVLLSSLFGVVVFWAFTYLTKRVVGAWHESLENE